MHNLKKQLSEIDTNQKKISEYRPYRTDFLPTLKNYYRVGIVYSSNAIEGITYTETETKVLIEDGLTAGGKPLSELYAVLGHAEAYNFMFDLARTTHKLTEADLLTLHKLVGGENGKGFSNDTVPGEYRKRAALISGSDYPLTSSALIPAEIRGMFEWIDSSREKYHPVEFAALLHKKLIFIHPFADGNGRVIRLMLNARLMQKGFVPTIILTLIFYLQPVV